jgi:hypothetical protein
MIVIPYERLTIKSMLRAEEAQRKLEDIIEPRAFMRWWTVNKPYEGKIEGSHFDVNRVILYRNSFRPVIKGDIRPEMGGCSISISMSPHILVLVFMGLWLGGVGLGFLVALVSFLSSFVLKSPTIPFSPEALPPMLLITGGMFVFGYVMSLCGFKFESVKSKAFFCSLFQARKVYETGIVDLFKTR